MVKNTDLYLRNIVFGVADSLVSSVGLLAGIGVSGATRQMIVLTGIVYAFVEAFSMAVGSFLSEQSVEEFEIKREVSDLKPFIAGLTMFLSFILASFVPIVPYILFGLHEALWFSVGFSILVLFLVGLASARIVKVRVLKHGLKMMFLGGAAILIGVIVGTLVRVG